MKSFKDYILSSPSCQSLAEAKRPQLVGYEWRTKQGIRFSAREEGMVEAKVSDWDNALVSEISKKKIVHIYWIQGEDGKARPHGKISAMKALGMYEPQLKQSIKPYVDKINLDRYNMEAYLKEYSKRAMSSSPDSSSEGMSAVSQDAAKVYNYARHCIAKGNGRMSENTVFTRIGKCYVCFIVGINPKTDPSKTNAVGTLQDEGYPVIEWKEMKAIAKI
jgi:hypothetical protein